MIKDKAGLDEYFKKAKSFDYERRVSAVRSRNFAWVIAGISSLLAIASVSAVALLAPLKTVVPFVIRVDNATGIPEIMTTLSDGKQNYDEAVSKYFLARYVRVRESYSYIGREAIFNEVQLLSEFAERVEFAEYFNASNENSPQFRYGRDTNLEVEIRSLSFLNDSQAQVRYYQISKTKGVKTRTPWVATVTFAFNPDVIITDKDRMINPLGFLVTDYRADPEVVQ